MDRWSRRQALAFGTAALLVSPVTRRVPAARRGGAGPADDPFLLGVTSGDPDRESVVLWTRLAAPGGDPLGGGDVTVVWELAADPSFASITATGEATATADAAHSVHAVVPIAGPSWYRFRAGPWTSPAGRTAPVPAAPERLTIAAASCQHFETGFYAAHRDIAAWEPDLVMFLGDFIYEYDAHAVGGAVVRSHDGPEVRTLDEYRHRYAWYLADADLAAARAVAPWLAIWDDHEVENNYAGLTPEDPAEADSFPARRLAAYQAWWGHMPVRSPRPAGVSDLTIHRTVEWGDLAKLIVLDGRQFRSDQACGDVVLSFEPACPEALDPARTMLGLDQQHWVTTELAEVTQRWAVIGQQTVVSDLSLPSGAILNYDQGDGYGPARDQLLLSAAQAERTVILTGDIHVAAVGRIPGVGAEFVSTSVSSLPPDLPGDVADSVSELFPDIVAAEFAHRGYVRHTVTPDEWIAEYRTVDDASDPASPVSTWRTFAVDAATPDVIVSR